MTQKIFDTDNAEDMADLWDIVPDKVYLIARGICDSDIRLWYNTKGGKTSADCYLCDFLKINWHDKTEITRTVKEATEADIGKICKFWSGKDSAIGILKEIGDHSTVDVYLMDNSVNGIWFVHCRRLTEQEIEELC